LAVPKNLEVSLNSADDTAPEERARVVPRHGNKTAASIYAGFSLMTLHRLMNDPDQDFPRPSKVLSKESLSFDEIDEWFRKRKKQKKPPATNANNG
jgi:predicted DNA-binding transcriptional regulator AlpA